jgi:hypothetical protein
MDANTLAELGVALNEATLLGVEVDIATRRAAVTLPVLSLSEEGREKARREAR